MSRKRRADTVVAHKHLSNDLVLQLLGEISLLYTCKIASRAKESCMKSSMSMSLENDGCIQRLSYFLVFRPFCSHPRKNYQATREELEAQIKRTSKAVLQPAQEQ